MSEEKGMLIKSPLFLNLTRPAMKFGVTMDYLSLSALITLCCFIVGNNPLYGLVYLSLHAVGWLLCRFDSFIFNLIFRASECAYCPNKKLWGCKSYEPY